MNWASIGRFLLEHGLPVLVAGGTGLLLGGRRRAAADAADNATDQALAAALKKTAGAAPRSEPFHDEVTKPTGITRP
jgi:hypothetical protein